MKRIDFSESDLNALPKTCEEALRAGSKYYFTREECPKGHIFAKVTNKKKCLLCIRMENNQIAERRRRRLGCRIMEDSAPVPLNKGERFGKLVALGEIVVKHNGNRNIKYHRVRCDCGKEYDLGIGQWGESTQCFECMRADPALHKLRSDKKIENSELKGQSHSMEGRLFFAARSRAKKYGREFSLTIEDIKIPEVCPILGIPLIKINEKRSKAQSPEDNSPSIDRIDSSKGYTRENIECISFRANSIKNNGTAYDHLLIGKYLKFLEQGKIKKYSGVNFNKKLHDFQGHKGSSWTLEELQALPSSRGEAIELGKNFYFSGTLCKKKHLSPRIIDSKCRQCRNERETARYKSLSSGKKKIVKIEDILNDRSLLMSIEEAVSRKIQYFFPNEPCKNNHTSAWTLQKEHGRLYPKCLQCKREAARKWANENYEKRGYDKDLITNSTAGFLYNSAKQRAGKKSIGISIQLSDIIIPKYCPIFGIELDLTWGGNLQNNEDRSKKVSLDRIDSNIGYTPENIIIISYKANIVKGQGTANEHLLIAEHMERQNK